jgi:nicotinate-nucleotide adenylyltransferase
LSLRAKLPPDGELFFLMGADSFLGLHSWHRAAEIPFAASLIVASRPGQELDDLRAALPAGLAIQATPDSLQQDGSIELGRSKVRSFLVSDDAGRTAPFYLLPDLHVEISASAVRDQVGAASGQPGRDLLPEPVSMYIRTHHLYREF